MEVPVRHSVIGFASTAAAAAIMALFSAGAAEPARAPLTSEQEKAVEDIVREYLTSNPEIIVEAIEKLRQKQRLAAEERAREAVKAHRDELFADATSPVAGNANGDVTVVEFFDYRCGYCKSVFAMLLKTVKNDGRVRLVFKEFPILGPASRFAAKAALAARKQGKYLAYHTALMRVRGNLSEAAVLAVAKSVGLDVARLKNDMHAPEIAAILERNFRLASALAIRGTPAFVIGDRLVPGAVNAETLKSLIAETRRQG